MHPLDSSLDASVHGHQGFNTHSKKKARRRTSLDNGYLDRPDLMLTVRYNSGCFTHSNNGLLGGDSYSDHHHRGGYTPDRPRRLSLNNTVATPAFFLAGSNYNVSTALKSDLDVDCHAMLDDIAGSSSRMSYHSSSKTSLAACMDASGSALVSQHSSRASLDAMHGGSKHGTPTGAATARSHIVVPDQQHGEYYNSDDFNSDNDDDEDSFGEASCTAPPNQEYMMQDLGASCFWHDEDLICQAERENADEEAVAAATAAAAEASALLVQKQQTPTVNAAVDFKYLGSQDNSSLVNVVDPPDDDDLHMIGGVGDGGVAAAHLLDHDHINGSSHHAAAVIRSSDTDDSESDSDCDSFCDATEKEPANKVYLKTDLGASCFWSSKDELDILDDSERSSSSQAAAVASAAAITLTPNDIVTIAEEH